MIDQNPIVEQEPTIYNSFLKKKIFKIYQHEEENEFSIEDIINIDKKELKNIGFVIISEYNLPEKYFTIKIHEKVGENENEIMINIVDNSHFIQYND